MKEFDKRIFFILLALSLVWLYVVWDSSHVLANLSLAATGFLLYIFVTKVYEERSGFFSVLIFLSTLGVGLGANYSGRGALVALLLTLFFLLYLWERYWWLYSILIVSIFLYGFWLAFFVLLIVFLHCLLLGRVERLGNMHLIRGLLLVGAVTLPAAFYFHPTFDFDLAKEIFALAPLSPRIKYPFAPDLVSTLVGLITLALPWFFAFLRGIGQSVSDCRNDEWERHVLLHLWWILGLTGVLCLGAEYYPLLIGIFPPIAILLGWCCQRLENNFNPYHPDFSPLWDWGFSSLVTALLWFYLGIWHKDLFFQCDLVALLFLAFAFVANGIYWKFKDVNLFILLQIMAGLVQVAFFYIYFYPL